MEGLRTHGLLSQENLAAFDVTLSEEVLQDIDGVFRRYRDPAFN
jgi:aryl-alcohol dehydrogenase-like predicted oxidoreductase